MSMLTRIRIGRPSLNCAFVLMLYAMAVPSVTEARCFAPLDDATKRDPNEFKDLEALGPPNGTLPSPGRGVEKLQPPQTGNGDINIDFYWVTFTRPKDVSGKEFFKKIRLQFGVFATGSDAGFAFGPYETSDSESDRDRRLNQEKWESDDPKGALMSFKLAGIPFTRLKAGKPSLVEKSGDVQAICTSDLDFVFVTVESEVAGMHPVAGYRGFGLMADPNSETWTFYSKAIDRDSGAAGNQLAYFNTRNGYDRNNLFCKGHAFWIQFFGEIRRFVEKEGMKVVDWNLSNHGPVTYPLGQGTGPWTPLDCETETAPKKETGDE